MTLDGPISNLTLALFALLTVVVPIWLSSRRKTADHKEAQEARKLEWERQDKVAAQAAEAASLLLAANERVAKASGEMKEQLNGLDKKVDVVHTWVNSKMTEEMQNRLEEMQNRLGEMQRSLVGLQEIVSLKKDVGHEPSPEALAAIADMKLRIEELKLRIEELKKKVEARHDQQKAIDEQSGSAHTVQTPSTAAATAETPRTVATITTIKVPAPNG